MASLFVRFPGGRAKAFTVSYDDGLQSDTRLAEMLRARGMKGTFNVGSKMQAPSGYVYPEGATFRHHTPESRPTGYEGMEVAIHGVTHPFLERLPAPLIIKEVWEDRRALEAEFDAIIQGAAYPFGTFNDTVLEALRLCGIRWARTVRDTHGFALPKDWLLWDPTCHHNDPAVFDLAQRFMTGHPDKNTDRGPWVFYVWGHTYELEADQNWDRVEKLLDTVAGADDVWYASNGEIYDYVAAFDALVFSADGCTVHNPTAQQVWMDYDCRPFTVAPGQTVRLL